MRKNALQLWLKIENLDFEIFKNNILLRLTSDGKTILNFSLLGFTIDINRRKDSPDNIVHFELLNVEVATKRTIEAVAESAVQRSTGQSNDTKKVTLMGSCKLTSVCEYYIPALKCFK